MDLNTHKEQFSYAYVRAVAAVAGFAVTKPEVDVDSVDLAIADLGHLGLPRRPRVEVQAKCTAQGVLREDHLAFPLPRKNFDDLSTPDLLVPRILVVVQVPGDEPEDWLHQTEDQLALRRCGYWVSLRGAPEGGQETSVTVHVPRNQVFSPSSLRSILERIGRGENP